MWEGHPDSTLTFICRDQTPETRRGQKDKNIIRLTPGAPVGRTGQEPAAGWLCYTTFKHQAAASKLSVSHSVKLTASKP